MGFFDGIVGGIGKAVTGGDNKMQLQDYLKLAGAVAAGATGNVPALIALGSSYAGDATGNKMLKTAGDIGGLATGIGGIASAAGAGASAASTAAGAADAASDVANAATGVADAATAAGSAVPEAIASTADAAQSIATPIASDAAILTQGAQVTPEMIKGAGASGMLGGDLPTDLTSYMSEIENFAGPIPPEFGKDPSKYKTAIQNLLGETKEDRWNNATDLASDVAEGYATQGEPQQQVQELPWQDDGSYQNYIPTFADLQEFMASDQNSSSPYLSMFSKYPYGG